MYDFVGDIQNVKGFTRITDSKEVRTFKKTLNPPNAFIGWRTICDGFFVEALDGGYGRVYGFMGSAPEEDSMLYRIQ